ncbi:MAG TPA: hypothetical protein VHE59_16260 [Mucilaginibacter sp.]|nr:hypothetical protein [Mucilaginibacter sp.]
MKIYFLIIGFTGFCLFAKAQSAEVHFTQEQDQQFESQVKGYVRDFCYYLEDLANSGTNPADKKQLKKDIKSLFVNTAAIEVLSVSHPRRARSYPISDYLNIVGNYASKYKFVALQFYRVVVDINHLRDTTIDGENMYVGSYSYWQRFLSSNADKESNDYSKTDFSKGGSDETLKVGAFYIRKIKTKSNANKEQWYVLLGDIKAKEIKPI